MKKFFLLTTLLILATSSIQQKELVGSVVLISNGPGDFDTYNDLVYLDVKDYLKMDLLDQGTGNGYLHAQGSRMMFNLGGQLRTKWQTLLDSGSSSEWQNNPHLLKIYSMNTGKALESAYAFSQGLFPPGTGRLMDTNYPNSINEPPILNMQTTFSNSSVLPFQLSSHPISAIDAQADRYFMHSPEYGCPGYFYDIYHKHKEENYVEYSAYAAYMSQVLNYPISVFQTSEAFYKIQGYFHAEQSQYYKTGTYSSHLQTASKYDNLKKTYSAFITDYLFRNKTINETEYSPVKLWTTRIGQEIINQFMGQSETNFHEPKIQIFQGSSQNILAFLLALGETEVECIIESFPGHTGEKEFNKICEGIPKPGSNIMFSLYKENGDDYTITAEYNGKILNLCNGGWCLFRDGIENMKNLLVDEQLFNNKCDLYPDLKDRIRLKNKAVWVYKLVTVVALCLAAFFIFCLFVECVFRKRDQEVFLSTLKKYRSKKFKSKSSSKTSLE